MPVALPVGQHGFIYKSPTSVVESLQLDRCAVLLTDSGPFLCVFSFPDYEIEKSLMATAF